MFSLANHTGGRWSAVHRLLAVSFIAVILIWAVVRPIAPARIFKAEPVWGAKPVLGYFALTPSLKGSMMEGGALNPLQYQTIRRVAELEVEELRALEAESLAIILDEKLTLDEKRALIAEIGYNQQVHDIVREYQIQLARELNPLTYNRLVRWIEARWQVERKLHALPAQGSNPRSFEVFATYYDSGGAYYVALPDKCVKLTNGGSSICENHGYKVGVAYDVIVRYKKSVGARVGETGPWNVDDTYWATSGDSTPRRMFADLPLGMPQAQAAYFDGYNGGLDQYGRKVTGPFGIDLSRQVSKDIGLKPGNNDWVTVSFMWTENWGAGSSPGGTEVPGATPVVIQPFQTAPPKADGSIVHAVQYGDTLWSIAEAYGITLNELLNLNNLTEDAIILPGNELLVRLANVVVVAPSATMKATQTIPGARSTATRRSRHTPTALVNGNPNVKQETSSPTPDLNVNPGGLGLNLDVLMILIGGVIVLGVLLVMMGGFLIRDN